MNAGRRALAFLLSLACGLVAGDAEAHPIDNAYLDIDVRGAHVTVSVTFSLDVFSKYGHATDVLFREIGPVDANLDALEAHLLAGVTFVGFPGGGEDGGRLALTVTGREVDLATNRVTFELSGRFDRAPRDLEITYDVFRAQSPNHVGLAVIRAGGEEHQHNFREGDRTWRGVVASTGGAAGEPFWATAFEFVKLGIHHILTGYDHLLFVLALLLVTRTFGELLRVITAFTVAHSVTLALSTLGLVRLSPSIAEPAIALTIAYVGLENVMSRTTRHRWLLAGLFGLVHGFGFAGVLQEMNLTTRGLATSLFAFNVGVEIGQLAVVAALFPLLILLARRRERLHRWVARLGSVAVAAMGVVWFVARIA
ncbi:MAG: HupE/UreJ family protein [Planctomycetes bacterium]|nr:HupE/UreJ family protein [Planctomycetota bacterium]MBI3843124.1 HupE/UreJ family protein [Planctomycetota bacterium]